MQEKESPYAEKLAHAAVPDTWVVEVFPPPDVPDVPDELEEFDVEVEPPVPVCEVLVPLFPVDVPVGPVVPVVPVVPEGVPLPGEEVDPLVQDNRKSPAAIAAEVLKNVVLAII